MTVVSKYITKLVMISLIIMLHQVRSTDEESAKIKHERLSKKFSKIIPPAIGNRITKNTGCPVGTTLQNYELFCLIATNLDAQDVMKLGMVSHLTHWHSRKYFSSRLVEFGMNTKPNSYASVIFHKFLKDGNLPKTKYFNSIMKEAFALSNYLMIIEPSLKDPELKNYFTKNPKHFLVVDIRTQRSGKMTLATQDIPREVKNLVLVNTAENLKNIDDNSLSSNNLVDIEIFMPKVAHIGQGFMRRSNSLKKANLIVPNLLHVGRAFLANCPNLLWVDLATMQNVTFLDIQMSTESMKWLFNSSKMLQKVIVSNAQQQKDVEHGLFKREGVEIVSKRPSP